MASCAVCGTRDGFDFRCSLCKDTHCSSHRLPEAHDCVGLIVAKHIDRRWFKEGPEFSSLFRDVDPEDVSEGVLQEIADELPEGASIRQSGSSDRLQATRDVIEHVAATQTEEAESTAATGDLVADPKNKPYAVYKPDYTVGTTRDPSYEPSPDVLPDGSVDRAGVTDVPDDVPGLALLSRARVRYLVAKYGPAVVLAGVAGAVVYYVVL